MHGKTSARPASQKPCDRTGRPGSLHAARRAQSNLPSCLLRRCPHCLLPYLRKQNGTRVVSARPAKLSITAPKSRYQKDLARVRIFHFCTWRVAFHVNFPGIRRVRTDHTAGLTRHLGGNWVVLRLGRRRRRRRRKGFGRRGFLRCRLRRIFGHRAYWGGWTRDGTIAVAVPSPSCFRPACCLTSNQRHTKSDRSQKNEVTNHREMYRSALVHPSSNDNRNPGGNLVRNRQFPPA